MITTVRPRLINSRIGHFLHIVSLAASPDGKTICSGGVMGGVSLWHARTGRHRRWWYVGSRVTDVDFSPAGGHVAAVRYGAGAIHLLPVSRLQRRRRLRGPDLQMGAVLYAPDGKRLYTSGDAVRVWNLDSSRAPQVLIRSEGYTGDGLAVSPDGRWLLAAGLLGVGRWDLATTPPAFQALPLAPSERWTGTGVREIRFSPDGSTVAAANRDAPLGIISTNTWAVAEEIGAAAGAIDLAFGKVRNLLATGHTEGTVKLLDTAVWSVVGSVSSGFVQSVALGAGGGILVVGQEDGRLDFWSIA